MESIDYANEIKMIAENMTAANDLMVRGCNKVAAALTELEKNNQEIKDLLKGFKV